MADNLTRREFVRDSAVAAAGVAVGLSGTYTVAAGNPTKVDTSKIMNYNADMEYRRCGKTDWMISAVCLISNVPPPNVPECRPQSGTLARVTSPIVQHRPDQQPCFAKPCQA